MTETFIHPVHSNYEVHLLPHLRVYNKTDRSYFSRDTDVIKLSVKSTKRYDLLKFIYECKEQKTLEKGKIVTLIDEDEPVSFDNIQVEDEAEEEVKEVIAITYSDSEAPVETKYPSVKEAKKATGVRIALIKYCCLGLADKVKNNSDAWFSFRYV